jgi:hypothetical protein
MTKWTLADIPSLHGKLAVVTGANSGIGWHSAFELAQAGSEVILTTTTNGKGRAAVDRQQLSAGERPDGGDRPGEFGRYGDGDRRVATRSPALRMGLSSAQACCGSSPSLTGGSSSSHHRTACKEKPMPELTQIDPGSAALLVMDYQVDALTRFMTVAQSADAIACVPELIATARDASMMVIHVAVAFRPGHPGVSPRNPCSAR